MNDIQIGNAPCSWGTLEFGSTKSDRIDYRQMLDELVSSGYTGCELGDWGFFPTDPGELVEAFAVRDLTLTGAYMGFRFGDTGVHNAAQEEAVKVARHMATVADRLGSAIRPFVVLADDNGTHPIRTQHAGRVTPQMMLPEGEWAIFAQGLEQVAHAVAVETGLSCVFHNHCAGFVEHPTEITYLLDRTNPDLVGLVLDTGHYAFADGGCNNLLAAFDQHGERIRYVHFKDCSPAVISQSRDNDWNYFEAVGNGIFCELGDGCVDFAGVLEWLKRRSYRGFITVEQDILPGMGAPLASAIRNRAYLRSLGL